MHANRIEAELLRVREAHPDLEEFFLTVLGFTRKAVRTVDRIREAISR